MLSKSFKGGKCKTSVKMAVARIKLLRNKREAQVRIMRRELAQLLDSGHEQTALIRVEHVIREEKIMSAYDLIELFCELIAARLPIIESQKMCPNDLKEAISTVIFASPRCADIPELKDIQKHFTAKYGKEFVSSALKVQPDCGVSRLVVEKLSSKAPDVDDKIKILTSIAQEHNVKWNSKAYDEQLKKPNDDLLNGPSTFSSGCNMTKVSVSGNYVPSTKQTKESRTFQKVVGKPTIVGTFSYNDRRASCIEPRASEGRGGSELDNLYHREETRNMEFKDVTSAAQAAAESAEMASLAARAAAELSMRENYSRQTSFGSNAAPIYTVNNETPDTLRRSTLKDEVVSEDVLPTVSLETRRSQDMKSETDGLQREASRSSSNFSINDSVLNYGSEFTTYNHSRQMSSASDAMEHDYENVRQDKAKYGYDFTKASEDDNINYSEYGTDVVYDDYGSDEADVDLGFGNHVGHSLNQEEKSSLPNSSGIRFENSSSRLHSYIDENVSAKFDDSDGLSSECEDQKEIFTKSPSYSYELKKALDDIASNEEVQPPLLPNSQSAKKIEADKPNIPSTFSGKSTQDLNYGRTIGGSKQRGLNKMELKSETRSNTAREAANIPKRSNYPRSSSRETIVPASNENINSTRSSELTASQENLRKIASHVHPKLPDYELLAARFKALRSNRI